MKKVIPVIPRSAMVEDFVANVQKVLDLVGYKNVNYGEGGDAFFNFRQVAQRMENDQSPDNMYKVLMTYMDKHMCALAKNKMEDKEFLERHLDIIVYSLIAMSMKQHLTESE